jgi:hypothetical protein
MKTKLISVRVTDTEYDTYFKLKREIELEESKTVSMSTVIRRIMREHINGNELKTTSKESGVPEASDEPEVSKTEPISSFNSMNLDY